MSDIEPTSDNILALYIRYVLRPNKVIHYCQDRGAFAGICRRVGVNAVAVFADDDPHAILNENEIPADWRQFPLQKKPLDEDENTLALVTKIPYEGIYFTAPVMIENWINSSPRYLWLVDTKLDRWIIDYGFRSYIVDIDATIHANAELSHVIGKSVILKRTC